VTGDQVYDAVVVGSGFGGAMVAHQLVAAGERVLMVERGDWVTRGPHNRAPGGAWAVEPDHARETPWQVDVATNRRIEAFHCVCGPSVFYGGAALRFREADFYVNPEIVGDSGAAWPFGYDELEPYYTAAERLLGVAGESGTDPTEPARSAPFPYDPGPLSGAGRILGDAALRLGLHPFRIPLAINYEAGGGRAACERCSTCDGFACPVSAKNDLATCVLPALVRAGMELRTNTAAVRLRAAGGRVRGVECVDRQTGERWTARGARYVLAAGALVTPYLLLASGAEQLAPGGDVVGRYLMRHRNSIVFGVFPRRPNAALEFHKHFAIHDFYFGHPSPNAPPGKLGGIQQWAPPPPSSVRVMLRDRRPLNHVLAPGVPLTTGLLTIAEDQPQSGNGVHVDASRRGPFGLPRLAVTHRYARRDEAAGRVLVREAKRIMRAAGAVYSYVYEIDTFSHALGTVRMGSDPRRSALDENGRFRGLENLYVADGSAFPTSGGVNPSLTIAACALRVGARLAGASAPLGVPPLHMAGPLAG